MQNQVQENKNSLNQGRRNRARVFATLPLGSVSIFDAREPAAVLSKGLEMKTQEEKKSKGFGRTVNLVMTGHSITIADAETGDFLKSFEVHRGVREEIMMHLLAYEMVIGEQTKACFPWTKDRGEEFPGNEMYQKLFNEIVERQKNAYVDMKDAEEASSLSLAEYKRGEFAAYGEVIKLMEKIEGKEIFKLSDGPATKPNV